MGRGPRPSMPKRTEWAHGTEAKPTSAISFWSLPCAMAVASTWGSGVGHIDHHSHELRKALVCGSGHTQGQLRIAGPCITITPTTYSGVAKEHQDTGKQSRGPHSILPVAYALLVVPILALTSLASCADTWRSVSTTLCVREGLNTLCVRVRVRVPWSAYSYTGAT